MERLQEHTTIFYSTHILDDVQRVSDYVAILDHGRLLASATTTELLNGANASYRVTIRGDVSRHARALAQEPWVLDTSVEPDGETTTLTVTVADERAAEERLLRTVLASPDTVVTAFGRRTYNLEDVFLQLVEGKNE
jgi:ABC-2 type transport system ATP-binding protein